VWILGGGCGVTSIGKTSFFGRMGRCFGGNRGDGFPHCVRGGRRAW